MERRVLVSGKWEKNNLRRKGMNWKRDKGKKKV
jgi:hypothetical protein